MKKLLRICAFVIGILCCAPANAKFAITTIPGIDSFAVYIYAAGTFTIDWGDGNTETVTGSATARKACSHTYSSAGQYKITIDGQATRYISTASYSAIYSAFSVNTMFTGMASSNCSNTVFANARKVQKLEGDIASVFNSIDATSSSEMNNPLFGESFACTTNLESIPENLFGSLDAHGRTYMFVGTFLGSGISGQLPERLFGKIAYMKNYMFQYTFAGCTNLTGYIPGLLFTTLNNNRIMEATYSENPGYLPTGLVTGDTAPLLGMFDGCTGLDTSCNFPGVTGHNYVFPNTNYAICFNICARDRYLQSYSNLSVFFSYPGLTPQAVGTSSSSYYCECPIGTYRDSDDIGEFCSACPWGYTTPLTDMRSISYCSITCDAGTYKTDSTATSCDGVCSAGTYSARHLSFYGSTDSCNECSAGTFNPNTGSTSSSACTACSAGTFNPNTGSTSSSACTTCPSGYPNSSAGAPAKTSCYSNTKSRAWTGSQTTCTTPTGCTSATCNSCSGSACSYVAYSNSAGTGDGTIKSGCSSNSANCTQTVASVTAQAGYYANGTSCTACSAGTYAADTGSSSCTECSAGTYAANTGSSSCTACPAGTLSTTTGNISSSSCTSAPFVVTTTSGTTSFGFNLTATGDFVVNWGDGQVQTISKSDTSATSVSRSDLASGSHTIAIGGTATGYNTDWLTPAISFSGNTNLYGISGNLSTIFPTLSNGPRFTNTFNGCTNLTGTIPSTLFSDLSGSFLTNQFGGLFYGDSKLTGTIPGELFGNLSGGVENTFYDTFNGCSGLTSIGTGLFDRVTSVSSSGVFHSTFQGCTGLTSLPAGLFKNLTGSVGISSFHFTFSGCSGLKGSIPSDLFGNLSSIGGTWGFAYTFNGCSGLTGTIPDNLFKVSGSVKHGMFAGTFQGCSGLTGYISPALFSKITGTGDNTTYSGTFSGCSSMDTACPSGTGSTTTTGYNYSFMNGVAVCRVCNDTEVSTGVNTCATLCEIPGIRYLNTSTGVKIPLYTTKQTTTALVVAYQDEMCYANLQEGESSGAINIVYDSKTYHATN